MNHSRAFLHCIYRMYVKRACENLGVSSKSEEDDVENEEDSYFNEYELDNSDYPIEFTKLPPKPNKVIESSPEKTREFLSSFGGAEVFKNVKIAEDD